MQITITEALEAAERTRDRLMSHYNTGGPADSDSKMVIDYLESLNVNHGFTMPGKPEPPASQKSVTDLLETIVSNTSPDNMAEAFANGYRRAFS